MKLPIFLVLSLGMAAPMSGAMAKDSSAEDLFDSPPARLAGYVYVNAKPVTAGDYELVASAGAWSKVADVDDAGRYRLDILTNDGVEPGDRVELTLMRDGGSGSSKQMVTVPNFGSLERVDLNY